MAAMTESVNIKILGVLALITVLLVMNVTIGMQAFVKWAQQAEDQRKVYSTTLDIEHAKAREQETLRSPGYSVERQAYRIPIEQAMALVVRQGGE